MRRSRMTTMLSSFASLPLRQDPDEKQTTGFPSGASTSNIITRLWTLMERPVSVISWWPTMSSTRPDTSDQKKGREIDVNYCAFVNFWDFEKKINKIGVN